MSCLPDQSGVIYRTGFEDRDYDEAIEALQAAKRQRGLESKGCIVCWDSGHVANQCHHNPLVMARRAALSVRVWRCFHCDQVFTDAEKAQEHFGMLGARPPKCLTPQPTYTYASQQATKCAVCGENKHTPLRNDTMGGYVCLTCIDRELIRLQNHA